MFTSCILVILTISRAIIQLCMGDSGRALKESRSPGYLTTVQV